MSMKTRFTLAPNSLLDAVIKFKCPDAWKELILALIRLTKDCPRKECAVSISCLSKFLSQDKSNIAKRLKSLIDSNVIKEISAPNCMEARRIKINRNYKVWRPQKRQSLKAKLYKTKLNPVSEPGSVILMPASEVPKEANSLYTGHNPIHEAGHNEKP